MRAFAFLLVAFVGVAAAFRPTPRFQINQFRTSRIFAEKTDLVPLEKTNIENAAAVSGGLLGFFVGGPVLGLIVAAVSNYVVKKDNDAGTALRGLGKTVIESYNYLTQLNNKYDLTGKAGSAVNSAITSAEAQNEGIENAKKTVDSTIGKLGEINKEFDLVTKAKEALVAASTLTDAALEKVDELNSKVRTTITETTNLYSNLVVLRRI
jgi:hypothetical protein